MGNCLSSEDAHVNIPSSTMGASNSPNGTGYASPNMSEAALSDFYARLGIRSPSTTSPYTESYEQEYRDESTTATSSQITDWDAPDQPYFNEFARNGGGFDVRQRLPDLPRVGRTKGEWEEEGGQNNWRLPHSISGSPPWSRQSSMVSVFTPTDPSLLPGINNKPNPLDPNADSRWRLETRPSSPESD